MERTQNRIIMGKVIELFNEQIENWSRMDGFNANEIKVQEMEHQANLEIQDKTTRIKEKRAGQCTFFISCNLTV